MVERFDVAGLARLGVDRIACFDVAIIGFGGNDAHLGEVILNDQFFGCLGIGQLERLREALGGVFGAREHHVVVGHDGIRLVSQVGALKLIHFSVSATNVSLIERAFGLVLGP
ncbi:hypothetical protein D3C71_1106350 [compost metagenome]